MRAPLAATESPVNKSQNHVMEKSVDSTHPDFWTSRYAAGKMPWDFGDVPTVLKSFLARSSASGKVLIPGCGSGYEVQAFHEAGYDVRSEERRVGKECRGG